MAFDHGPAKEVANASVCTPPTGEDRDYCKYRNYFQGRATAWNTNDNKVIGGRKAWSYRTLFPDVRDDLSVAKKMDILTEARGGRMAANFLVPFIR